ncbi:hypothetical protein DFH09DRAFT_1143153 [Mycena vulgaris]|nr:hypothetical protein DFH09DRAFT_1143153 [Mycena vulgaris]
MNSPTGNLGRRTSCWSDLPVDIFIFIMRFMAPYDIIALRKVSKSVSDATHERSVWIDALRRVCVQHDIYVPSFPLTEMSTSELEHAATACRRFTSHLRHEFQKRRIVWPRSIRYIEPVSLGEDFEHLRMFPGGRFLLTVWGCTLRLWDLGHHQNASSMKLIASFPIVDISEIQTVRTRASNSSSDALVFVSATGSDGVFRLHVFSVFPPASTPQFNLLAPVLSLPMDDGCPGILGITNRHVALNTGSIAVLWDFVEDSWISWPRKPTEYDDTFYLCNNNVVIMHADEAQIYLAPLPTLLPRSNLAVLPESEPLRIIQTYQLNRYSRPEPLSSCVSGITLVFHGRETSTPEQPLHIDILSEHDTKVLLTHFALLPAAQMDDTAACELVALGESLLEAAYRCSQSLHLEWLGPQSIQSFVLEGRKLHVCLSDVDGSSSSSLSGVLATPGLLQGEINTDFCSFSGRGCGRKLEGGMFKVMVMDYLP